MYQVIRPGSKKDAKMDTHLIFVKISNMLDAALDIQGSMSWTALSAENQGRLSSIITTGFELQGMIISDQSKQIHELMDNSNVTAR